MILKITCLFLCHGIVSASVMVEKAHVLDTEANVSADQATSFVFLEKKKRKRTTEPSVLKSVDRTEGAALSRGKVDVSLVQIGAAGNSFLLSDDDELDFESIDERTKEMKELIKSMPKNTAGERASGRLNRTIQDWKKLEEWYKVEIEKLRPEYERIRSEAEALEQIHSESSFIEQTNEGSDQHSPSKMLKELEAIKKKAAGKQPLTQDVDNLKKELDNVINWVSKSDANLTKTYEITTKQVAEIRDLATKEEDAATAIRDAEKAQQKATKLHALMTKAGEQVDKIEDVVKREEDSQMDFLRDAADEGMRSSLKPASKSDGDVDTENQQKQDSSGQKTMKADADSLESPESSSEDTGDFDDEKHSSEVKSSEQTEDLEPEDGVLSQDSDEQSSEQTEDLEPEDGGLSQDSDEETHEEASSVGSDNSSVSEEETNGPNGDSSEPEVDTSGPSSNVSEEETNRPNDDSSEPEVDASGRSVDSGEASEEGPPEEANKSSEDSADGAGEQIASGTAETKKQAEGETKKQADSEAKKQTEGETKKQAEGETKKQAEGETKKQAEGETNKEDEGCK